MSFYRIKGLGKLSRELNSLSSKLIKGAGEEIGEYTVRSIKGSTRQGQQLITNNGRKRLKKIKKSTIESRRRLADVNDTHQAFRADKSQLTLTGQLLEALSYRVKGNLIQFFVASTRRKKYVMPPRKLPNQDRYRSPTSKERARFRREQADTNREVYENQKSQGRDFVQIDKRLEKQLVTIVIRWIRRNIRRI